MSKSSRKAYTIGQHRPSFSFNQKIVRPFLFAALIAAGISSMGAAENFFETHPNVTTDNYLSVTLSPNPVTNGKVVLLEVHTRSINQPIFGIQAKFHDKRIPLAMHPSNVNGIYFGLIGIPYHFSPGSTAVKLEWTNPHGYHSKIIPFNVNSAKYRSEKLKVDPQMINPSQDDRVRAKRELHEVKRIYLISSAVRLWHSPFQLPVETKVTSPFGARRLYNRKFKSFHSGVDFRANSNTPVHAVNTGIVRLAKHLYYSGNHVIVDHGLGLFTNYSHLSKIHVSPGQRIEKGELIGYAGETGRVNGPHLHWGAKVHGVSVDPLQLLEVLTSLMPVPPENS